MRTTTVGMSTIGLDGFWSECSTRFSGAKCRVRSRRRDEARCWSEAEAEGSVPRASKKAEERRAEKTQAAARKWKARVWRGR